VVARPTSLTPELQAALCEQVRHGMYLEPACALVGISKASVYDWKKRGADGEEPYATFLDALEKADAEAERWGLDAWTAPECDSQWTRWAAFMERRFRARWGREAQSDASAQQPPQVVVVQVDRDAKVSVQQPEAPK